MKFSWMGEFEQTAKKVIETATALIRKNKGIEVYLASYQLNTTDDGFIFKYTLTWPLWKEHKMSIHSNWFDTAKSDIRFLPLITNEIRRGLDTLRNSISELDFIIACVTTWIYLVGKRYGYF